MEFNTEQELVSKLIAVLKDLNCGEYFEIFQEVSLGYGIADLVISNFINAQCSNFKSRQCLNSRDINIYNIVRHSPSICISEIENISRDRKSNITKSIEKLLSEGYIEENEGTFEIGNSYQLTFNNIFAIEAKLKNWKQALKQAYRYKSFAEYSYVVIDETYIKPALLNVSLFERYNVGLASINQKGKLKRYFKPETQRPFDYKMQVLLSEKIKHSYELAR